MYRPLCLFVFVLCAFCFACCRFCCASTPRAARCASPSEPRAPPGRREGPQKDEMNPEHPTAARQMRTVAFLQDPQARVKANPAFQESKHMEQKNPFEKLKEQDRTSRATSRATRRFHGDVASFCQPRKCAHGPEAMPQISRLSVPRNWASWSCGFCRLWGCRLSAVWRLQGLLNRLADVPYVFTFSTHLRVPGKWRCWPGRSGEALQEEVGALRVHAAHHVCRRHLATPMLSMLSGTRTISPGLCQSLCVRWKCSGGCCNPPCSDRTLPFPWSVSLSLSLSLSLPLSVSASASASASVSVSVSVSAPSLSLSLSSVCLSLHVQQVLVL